MLRPIGRVAHSSISIHVTAMSDSKNRAGGPSTVRSTTSSSDYRTPISFYIMMGGILIGLLLVIVGLFIF